ncbi:MAG TPA: BON domain-containing protein, partial [Gemmataceae bacterium]
MFAPRTRRVLLYLALAAGVMISAGRGAEPAATSRDAELTLQAREALQSDPELRALNLGVEVRAGTATLWGSVARPEQARSAEEALLRIPGVASVRNDCHAGPVRDPLLERVADLVKRLPSLVPEDVPPLVALPPHPAFPSEGNAPPGGRVTTHFHG